MYVTEDFFNDDDHDDLIMNYLPRRRSNLNRPGPFSKGLDGGRVRKGPRPPPAQVVLDEMAPLLQHQPERCGRGAG